MSKHRIASSQRWFAFFCSRGNGGTQQAGDLSMAAKLVRGRTGVRTPACLASPPRMFHCLQALVFTSSALASFGAYRLLQER